MKNVQELFVGHGSYLRREGQVLMHSLSKYTALVEKFNETPNVVFQGQEPARVRLYSIKKGKIVKLN